MRNLWLSIIIILFISGCGSSFKSNFRDFNAYYNTYYNAKQSYQRGLKKSLDQDRTYNTLQPIRIYETPKGAGAGDFENAIDKGASVLRNYDDTKWVDNALEIIGKSYYFRNEYFNAIQKFDELYVNADDIELRQRSVYWKGRVLLELQAYNEGIQFLNEELSLNEGEWRSKLEWQVKVVLAEHYIANENWVNALDLLNESVGKIPDRANNERGFFLIGQINEQIGDSEAAFDAYDRVGRYYTNYDLQFEAKKKKAEVARDLGDIDEAIKVFRDMVRDDKNTEFISELNYELGKSEQIKGNAERARDIYLSILRDPLNKPNNEVKALTYNGLAELNRFEFDNFTFAAAYYDSSARLNISIDRLPDDYDARNLADSFGAYANLKYQVYEQDSLLWLGSLSEEVFDSVLKEIEAKKLAEFERLREEQEARRNTLVNVGADNSEFQNNDAENGFLNVRNPVLIAEATERFQAIWGIRPLVDNWRVNSLIINALVEDSTQTGINENAIGETTTTIDLNIDLSRIPFTPSDQDSVRDIVANLKYELGNLFFLQLDLPDSASYYFRKVVEERPNSRVVPITLYSLSELYDIQGDETQSYSFAKQLIDQYPNTEYAYRLTSKFELSLPDDITYSEVNPLDMYYEILNNQDIPDRVRAEQLAEIATKYPNESFSDRALFESIKEYIKLGKTDSIFVSNYDLWFAENQRWEIEETEFIFLKDSLNMAFEDSSIIFSIEDSLFYDLISDSVLTQPDLTSIFPYSGEMWDSTRSKIDVFGITFNNSKYSSQVRTLKSEFQIPVISVVETPETEQVEEAAQINSGYVSCRDQEFTLEIRGGADELDAALQVSQEIQDETITFLFYVNQRGIIDEFQLASDTQDDALISTYVDAIDKFISFEPVLINGVAQSVACEVEFTIPR